MANADAGNVSTIAPAKNAANVLPRIVFFFLRFIMAPFMDRLTLNGLEK
ncbi:MAG TPA: hypothetical protein VGK21_09695 [Candidatus Angelobacter sp.]